MTASVERHIPWRMLNLMESAVNEPKLPEMKWDYPG
jgi:hypothetical protein